MNVSLILFNGFLFLVVVFVVYVVVNGLPNIKHKEGFTDASSNGIAGNAASYDAKLKSATTQLQDKLLISKYSADYENVIVDMDDLIDSLILAEILNINPTSPQASVKQIAELSQVKGALNGSLKFINANK